MDVGRRLGNQMRNIFRSIGMHDKISNETGSCSSYSCIPCSLVYVQAYRINFPTLRTYLTWEMETTQGAGARDVGRRHDSHEQEHRCYFSNRHENEHPKPQTDELSHNLRVVEVLSREC